MRKCRIGIRLIDPYCNLRRRVIENVPIYYILQIPIYPGCSEPISEFRKSDNFFGKDGLGDSPVPQPEESREIEKENAVPFLLRMVKEFPGEITIVALGPLTNIAMAIKMDPLFLDLVKVVVWSGGSVEGVGNVEPGLEFNSYFDPMATHIVFNKTKCPVVVVPWELIVFYAKTTVDWRENVLGSVETKLVDYINAIENYSIKHSGTWVAADVKTMFVALFPQFVTKSEFIHMEGIYEGGHTKGLLLLDYARSNGKYCNALVIRGLNVEQFQNKLLQAFTLREDVSKNSRVQMPEYRFALVK